MKVKKQNIHDIIFIAVFLCILFLPMFFFHDEEGRTSYVENKVLESRPDLSEVSMWDSGFTNAIENYICDRIGFREEMILANIAFMNSFFNDFEVTNVLKGKDQHTFYMNTSIMECYQGLDEINSEQMTEVISAFNMLNEAAESREITFAFMPIPNKDGIYSEYMPDDIEVISDNSMLKSIKNYLQDNTDVTVIDVYSALVNSKTDDDLLYYRNYDPSHWNMRGALIGYLELMNTFKSKADEICFNYPDINDYIIKRDEVYCAASYLQRYKIIQKTFADMSDYLYTVEPIGGYTYNIGDDNDERLHLYHYYNDTLKYKKTIMVIGDSYTYQFMLPMLAESFSDVYFVPYLASDDIISEKLKEAKPDYLVYEIVERMTDYNTINSEVRSLADIIVASTDDPYSMYSIDKYWTKGVLNSNHNVILFSKENCSVKFAAGMKFVLDNGSIITVDSVKETEKDYVVTFDDIDEESYEYSQYPHVYRYLE